MEYCYLHILCEGQSEEDFVKNHLEKYFQQFSIYVTYSLITTNRDLNKKGGNTDYLKIKGDIERLLKVPTFIVTTMIDYYKLPNNFPSHRNCCKYNKVYEVKDCLEKAWANDIGEHRFIPYIQLHEFEALIFGDINNIQLSSKSNIKTILENFQNNPELINTNNPPSTRLSTFVKDYLLAKSLISTHITKNISITNIRKSCPGFNQWIDNILNKCKKV